MKTLNVGKHGIHERRRMQIVMEEQPRFRTLEDIWEENHRRPFYAEHFLGNIIKVLARKENGRFHTLVFSHDGKAEPMELRPYCCAEPVDRAEIMIPESVIVP